jgi:hypothetical protein
MKNIHITLELLFILMLLSIIIDYYSTYNNESQ